MQNRKSQSGFSLLELLVSLVILGTLMGGLGTALRTGLDANERARSKVDSSQETRIVLDALRADIEQADVTPGAERSWLIGLDQRNGENDADDLQLTTRSHRVPLRDLSSTDDWETQPHHPDWSAVTYSLTSMEGNDTGGLYRREQSPPGMDPTEEPAEDTVKEELLSPAVVGLNFRFFDGIDWLDSWDTTADAQAAGTETPGMDTTTASTVPLAVEVTVVFRPESEGGREQTVTAVFPIWQQPSTGAAATTTGGTPSGGTMGGSGGALAGGGAPRAGGFRR